MTRRPRPALLALGCVSIALSTAGCSAVQIGAIAVTIDTDGTFQAHVRICDGDTADHLRVLDDRGVTLLRLDTNGGWADGDVVPLVHADGRPLDVARMQPDWSLEVDGWRSSWEVLDSVSGTALQWQTLAPGEVLVPTLAASPSAASPGPAVEVTTLEAWSRSACASPL